MSEEPSEDEESELGELSADEEQLVRDFRARRAKDRKRGARDSSLATDSTPSGAYRRMAAGWHDVDYVDVLEVLNLTGRK